MTEVIKQFGALSPSQTLRLYQGELMTEVSK